MASRKIETQEQQTGQGFFVEPGLLARLVERSVQVAIDAEFERYIGASHYERAPGRRDWRNGTKPRTMKTAVGQLHLAVPQSREGGFRPRAFEHYQRSDKALVAAMQEMVIQGVSTRKVAAVLEQMAGFELSATTVSRASAGLDEEITQFRTRRLDERHWPYVVIDARYERVRKGGHIVDQAVLVVAGLDDEGRRRILGWSICDSESREAWGDLFRDLKIRGLSGVKMVVSDAHRGIRAALARHFQGTLWQRCRVHLMREVLYSVSYKHHKDLAQDIKAIFADQPRTQCRLVAAEVADKWRKVSTKVSTKIEDGLEDCLTVHEMPARLRSRLHSTNMLERLMRHLKQRTRVVSIFPSVSSLDRLIGSLLIEIDERWQCEPCRYVTLDRHEHLPEEWTEKESTE